MKISANTVRASHVNPKSQESAGCVGKPTTKSTVRKVIPFGQLNTKGTSGFSSCGPFFC